MENEKQQEDLSGSIEAERERLRNNCEKGTHCRCCGQMVKLYKRKFNTGCARFMIALYNLSVRKMNKNPSERGWGYFTNDEIRKEAKLDSKGLDYSIVRHWGLAEQGINDDDKKRDSGTWKITVQGYMFVQKQLPIASHVFLYNNKCEGYGDTTMHIDKALGSDFNYQELINHG